ncbi:MAG: YchJ family metal-binding protein [Pseudomonadota bacterium]
MNPCPCGSSRPIAACCGRYLDSQTPAPDAEALMRSRYTAYVLGNEAYLLETWHPTTRPLTLRLDEEPRPRWIGLTVKRHEMQDANHAVVEFVARYKINGRAFKLHEVSRFVREDGRWFYVDGDTGE